MKNLGLFFICLLSLNLFAEPSEEQKWKRFKRGDPGARSSVGAAFGDQTQVYKEGTKRFNAIPFMAFTFGKFYFQGIRAGYRFYDKRGLQLHGTLGPNLFGLDSQDAAIKRRHETAHAGLMAIKRLPKNFIVRANIDHDILSRHQSFLGGLSLSRPFRLKKFMLVPGIYGTYYSKRYVDYYFGVDQEEVGVDRPVYNPGSSIEYGPSIRVMYFINRSWALMTFGRYGFYDGEISDSPLVRTDYRAMWFAGFSYNF